MTRRGMISIATAGVVLLVSCGVASANPLSLDICGGGARVVGDGLSSTADPGTAATVSCPSSDNRGTGLDLRSAAGRAAHNASAGFKVTAPAGIVINSIHVVGAFSLGVGEKRDQWWGEFYWNGGAGPAGRSAPITYSPFRSGGCCSQTNLSSQSIGWFMACAASSCTETGDLQVPELQLSADEQRAPAIIAAGADNLWYQSGWVRGSWPAPIAASDPSGVCGASVSFGSLPAPFSGRPEIPNHHTWKQCSDQSVSATVDTTASDGSLGRGVGAMPLSLAATNAANVTANTAKTVYVDNQAPVVSLSAPTTDASTAAGPQTITAIATAGPSGVSGISCSLDGGPYQTHPGASTQLAVQGVGTHTASCVAANNAHARDGSVGQSAPAGFLLRIRQPSAAAISFAKLARLRCRRVHERILIPGRSVLIRRHHKLIRVRIRAHRKLVTVTRCQARHIVSTSTRRVPYGHRTTVSGWLGTTSFAALPEETIRVLTAPDNGLGHYTQATTAITRADGSWSATLPAGPSRLVLAAYGGNARTLPTFSAPVHLLVPARIAISITPRRLPWSATLTITGHLLGGYVPPDGVALRLLVRYSGSSLPSPLLALRTNARGEFRILWSYHAGRGVASYPFSVATTATESDYPFTSSSSRALPITFGVPTPHHQRVGRRRRR